MLRLEAGYTGDHTVRVIDAQNLVAGAAPIGIEDIGGTIGVAAESQGSSTGDNVGVYSIAGYATGRNIAGFFRAYQDSSTSTPGTNVGILSVAGHYGDNYQPTPTAPEIGGYFALGTYYDPRPNLATSSALIADNGDMTAAPIFIGRVDGTNAFQITGTGGVLDQPSVDATNLWQVQNHAGSTFFDLDSANQRVGIGTSTPSANVAIAVTNGSTPDLLLENLVSGGNPWFELENGNGATYGFVDSTSDNGLRVQVNGSSKYEFDQGEFDIGALGYGGAMLYISSSSPSIPLFRASLGPSGNDNVIITQSAYLGVDTLTPYSPLQVTGPDTAPTSAFAVVNSASTTVFSVFDNGTIGIGTTTPWGMVSIQPATAGSTTPQFVSWVSGSSTPAFIVSSANNNGNVGIGTTSPAVSLAVNGQIVTNNLQANASGNTLCYSSSNYGIIGTCTSDERLKNSIVPLSASSSIDMLSAVLALQPVTFKWDGDDSDLYAGFIAQQVQQSIPLATRMASNGYYTLDTTAIDSYLTGAIQEIANISSTFQQNLIAWLGNASNGIGDLFANNIHAQNELCVGSTCVTPAQFQAIVAAANASQSSGQGSSSDSDSNAASSLSDSSATPPVLQLNHHRLKPMGFLRTG